MEWHDEGIVLAARKHVTRMVAMIQKEMADRIRRNQPLPAFGRSSLDGMPGDGDMSNNGGLGGDGLTTTTRRRVDSCRTLI